MFFLGRCVLVGSFFMLLLCYGGPMDGGCIVAVALLDSGVV